MAASGALVATQVVGGRDATGELHDDVHVLAVEGLIAAATDMGCRLTRPMQAAVDDEDEEDVE